MARSRNIKPGFFTNDELVEMPLSARLLFIGLWTIADREGRLIDRPKKIKMEIFPADDVDCDADLSKLASSGFITRYEADNIKVISIANFCKHQAPHTTEKDSVLPDDSGYYTVNERSPKGVITGKPRVITKLELVANVKPTLKNVDPPNNNALIPDSCFLIPDSVSPSVGAKKAEAPAKRTPDASGTRLPNDWKPSPEDTAFCKAERPDLIPSEVAKRFYDYWIAIPGAKGRKLNWSSTWRNWVRSQSINKDAPPPKKDRDWI